MLSLWLATWFAVSPAVPHAVVRYDGQALVRIDDAAPAQRDRAIRIAPAFRIGCDGPDTTVRATKAQLAALDDAGIAYSVLIPDLQRHVDAEAQRIAEYRRDPSGERFAEFLNLDDTNAHIDELATSHADLVAVETIGTSVEGREIRAVSVAADPGKPAIAILGGHHAREWLAHAGTLCMTDRLINGYGTDDAITELLDAVAFYVIPIANPDGFEYTWTTERYWRKNRGAEGYGVDLNRNWDIAWATGSSDDPEAEDFHGSGPFSEPETKAVADYLAGLDRVEGFVDIHSYGGFVLYPYGYTFDPSNAEAAYETLAQTMASATAGFGPPAYEPIRITDFVGDIVSGSSVDWVHENRPGSRSFAYEVSADDFVSTPGEIPATCDQVFEATIALMGHIAATAEPDTGDDDDDDDDDDTATGDAGAEDDDSGCGCTNADASRGSTPRWLFAGLALAMIGRRRRRG